MSIGTMTETPRQETRDPLTEAGRLLLTKLWLAPPEFAPDMGYDDCAEAIVAIEDEAADTAKRNALAGIAGAEASRHSETREVLLAAIHEWEHEARDREADRGASGASLLASGVLMRCARQVRAALREPEAPE
jgi:hypothetical protein